jgi:hypothetical protein
MRTWRRELTGGVAALHSVVHQLAVASHVQDVTAHEALALAGAFALWTFRLVCPHQGLTMLQCIVQHSRARQVACSFPSVRQQ